MSTIKEFKLYDIYEIRNASGEVINRIWQATEPAYDFMQLVRNEKSKHTEEVSVVNVGQSEKPGGEPM